MPDRLASLSFGDLLMLSLGLVWVTALGCFWFVSRAQGKRPRAPLPPDSGELAPLVRDFLRRGLILFGLTLLLLWAARARAAPPGPPEGMVEIPAGEFIMGSSEADITWAAKTFFSESLDYYLDETPAHRVHLPAFYLDRTEVTVAAYRAYLEATGAPPPKYLDHAKFNAPDQPVVGVNWKQASDYCAWAGKRLPTEAEWEKAARGTDARYYPWGHKPDPRRANVRGLEDGFRYTAPVGSFPEGAGPYGVLDLAGNVWEWTATWYGPHPGNTMQSDLFGEQFRVIKGGSWFSNLDLARASVRGKALPTQKQNYIGFRCAWPPAGAGAGKP